MKLNLEQDEAANHVSGPLLILAGAGSGKTRVITHRIYNLIENHKISNKRICAVTFTNKGAKEMKQRLCAMMNRKLKGLFVGTFHSLGLVILRENFEHLQIQENFTIQNGDDQLSIVSDVLREFQVDTDEVNEKDALWAFSSAKNAARNISEASMIISDSNGKIFGHMFERYNEILLNYNSVDFDDLLLMPNELLQKNEPVRNKYRERFKYFLVDEFQDTNPLQFSFLMNLLSEPYNLFAVGDDDQSIYGWRGADIEIILGFKKIFPRAKIIYLEQNYRSKQNILDLANAVVQNNSERHAKKLWSQNKSPTRATIYEAADSSDEGDYIASQIDEIARFKNIEYNETAILFRTNFQSRPFEEALRRKMIPYRVSGSFQFYDRKEIKDIIAYLRFLANQNDDKSLSRIINFPKRNIGDKTLQKLRESSFENNTSLYEVIQEIEEFQIQLTSSTVSGILEFRELIEKYSSEIRKKGAFSNAIKSLIDRLQLEREFARSGLEDKVIQAKLQNIRELINSIYDFEQKMAEENKENLIYEYLRYISLMTDDDSKDDEEQKVNLMTIHNAKGLEFQSVYIVGAQEGMLPHRKTIDEEEGLGTVEEERRLFYVAITRAKDFIHFSYAKTSRSFSEEIINKASRFLTELPKELIDWQTLSDEEEAEGFSSMLKALDSF